MFSDMTRDDFSVGQTVYLKTISNWHDCWNREKILEATVTGIGRKYVTVAIGKDARGWECQFYIDEGFRQKTKYSPDYVLFLSKQDILDYWQSVYLRHSIEDELKKRYGHNQYRRGVTLQTLKNVATALGIPVESMDDTEKHNDIEE